MAGWLCFDLFCHVDDGNCSQSAAMAVSIHACGWLCGSCGPAAGSSVKEAEVTPAVCWTPITIPNIAGSETWIALGTVQYASWLVCRKVCSMHTGVVARCVVCVSGCVVCL